MTKNAGKSGKVLEAYKWCILQVLNEKELFVFYLILKSLTKMRKIYALMVLLFAVMYFILIRPQKKKEKALKDMISSLKVGDEVASIGGIHGKINRVKDNLFILETGVGTTKSYVTIEKSAIARLISEGTSKESDVAPLEEAADAE